MGPNLRPNSSSQHARAQSMDQGVSTALSELGLPTLSGKLGSMNVVGDPPLRCPPALARVITRGDMKPLIRIPVLM